MNTKVMSALLVATSMFALTAQAEQTVQSSKATNECMFATQPRSWRVLDQKQLVLWGPSQNDAYLVTLFSFVTDLPFAETLAFIDSDNNGRICGDGFDKVGVAHSRSGSWPMNIQSMVKLTDADLLALGEKHKVKLLSAKRMKALANAK
jgi:hypothetical protein